MEELLRKLSMLKKDGDIKTECGNRVFMNNKDTQVQMPYISYNPTVTGTSKMSKHSRHKANIYTEYTSQVNLYVANGYNFIKLYNAINSAMAEQKFNIISEFIDSTDSGDTWVCFRFSIVI